MLGVGADFDWCWGGSAWCCGGSAWGGYWRCLVLCWLCLVWVLALLGVVLALTGVVLDVHGGVAVADRRVSPAACCCHWLALAAHLLILLQVSNLAQQHVTAYMDSYEHVGGVTCTVHECVHREH